MPESRKKSRESICPFLLFMVGDSLIRFLAVANGTERDSMDVS